jgi:Family of unknown function (DUF6134)
MGKARGSREARRFFRKAIVILLFSGSFLPAGASGAEDVERRDFAIFVDGKRAGHYHMAITQREDGLSVMSGQADVQVSYLVYHYIYRYRGVEWWKGGRLERLQSSCNDNGKSLSVNAFADNGNLTVNANGSNRTCPPEAWTTSYWRLPAQKLREQPLTLLDCDSGRVLSAMLHHVGPAELNVGGERRMCQRYRLSGDLAAELWYDESERLVREDTVEEGHRTVVELARIRR